MLHTTRDRRVVHLFSCFRLFKWHFGSDGKESACNTGDPVSITGLGRSSGEGNGYPLQFSCLENPTDRRACRLQSMGCKESDTTEVPIIFTYWPILVIMRNTGTRDWKSTGISLFFLRNITLCMCERQREEREFFSTILRIICKK